MDKKAAQALLQKSFPKARLLEELPHSRHVFTHRVWNLYGWQGVLGNDMSFAEKDDYVLVNCAQLHTQYAIPNAFKAYRGNLEKRI